MKKITKRTLMIAITATILITSTLLVLASFTDTKDHWAKEYIDDLYKEKITQGYPDGSFKPDEEISIKEFATFLDKYFFKGFDRTGTTGSNYADEHIRFLEKQGILFDYGSKDANLTRIVALRTIISSIENSEDYLVDKDFLLNEFIDWENIKPDDYKYINLGIKEGVIHGYPEGVFLPDKIVTRAEAAKMLFLLKKHHKFNIKNVKENDLEVISVSGGRYKAGSKVTVSVIVRNNSNMKHETEVNLETVANNKHYVKPISLEKDEIKLIEYEIQLPIDIKGNYPFIATINKSRKIEEPNFVNNVKINNIEILEDPVIPDLNCPSESTWTETETKTQTITVGEKTETITVTYEFGYKATLKSKMTIKDDRELMSDPKMTKLKSGYGFKVDVESQINVQQISGAWQRQHTATVTVPSNATVVTSWKVVNIMNIGKETLLKRDHFSTGTSGGTSYFSTPVNEHNVEKPKVIYTDLDLKGNTENPYNHPFKVYVTGAEANGVGLCNTLEGYIEIFGDMHEDWKVN